MKILFIFILALICLRVYFIFIEGKSLYYPDKEVSATPESLGIDFEEVNFKTSDGEVLNGWFIPAEDSRIAVLYCHGNAGNISHRLHKAEFFHKMGVNFFIFDYRGYGKSSGFANEQGLYKDAQAAYDYLVSTGLAEAKKIVIYGKSLGGAVAADLCLRREAGLLVLEGSFSSVASLAQQLYPFLPMKFLVTQKYDTLSKIKSITIPKLVVHGRDDEVIDFRHGEILFEAASGRKEFLPFGGGHNDDLYVASSEYRAVLTGFFEDIFKSQ